MKKDFSVKKTCANCKHGGVIKKVFSRMTLCKVLRVMVRLNPSRQGCKHWA